MLKGAVAAAGGDWGIPFFEIIRLSESPRHRALPGGPPPFNKGGFLAVAGSHSIFFRLLDASNFLSFTHGFRLGMELAGWVRAE